MENNTVQVLFKQIDHKNLAKDHFPHKRSVNKNLAVFTQTEQ